ncbi:single-strand binding protein [Acidothermus cellulolyticus 11B]|uniref:Single-stranded DNA-binding protein n=1 Tax=Acidothermus cellulolyticus (strain ATCC 43068 / DSM 8971 / 11B) TaxID=351607 RepID=A0LVD2_ACIC1|nr:single-stranded DNA-binding protein [Acidothermus cellulolyticus]ABK53392.1 single-strand binding protein [Acidothermus cellulolyticus 11B]
MFDPQVTILGNVVADPRLNFTADGHAVASFRLAATPRRFDRTAGQWRDGETLFASVTCWRGLAENVAASLKRGQSVIVIGRLATRWYDAKDGSRREGVEIDALAVGPDLSRAVAVVKRAERAGVAHWPSPGNGSDRSDTELDRSDIEPDRSDIESAGSGAESAIASALEDDMTELATPA